jgi:hypothetical protein
LQPFFIAFFAGFFTSFFAGVFAIIGPLLHRPGWRGAPPGAIAASDSPDVCGQKKRG